MTTQQREVLIQRLKNGEYDGADIMAAWIALEDQAAQRGEVVVTEEMADAAKKEYEASEFRVMCHMDEDPWMEAIKAALNASHPQPAQQEWTEDGGQYTNDCIECGETFTGGKHRRKCKKCSQEPAQQVQGEVEPEWYKLKTED